MKVGVLVDQLIPGGFQKVALMETIGLKRLGYDAKLVVLKRTPKIGYMDIINENDIEVIFLSDRLPRYLNINFKFPFFSFLSLFHLTYYFFINRYVKKDEFDCFITHGTYTAFSSIAISKRSGIPYVVFIHDPISYVIEQKYRLGMVESIILSMGKYLDRKIIEHGKKVLAYPDMIRLMMKIVPDQNRYFPLWNGCEPIARDRIRYQKEKFAIAATKWDSGKNAELLLDVWSGLRKSIPLKIIGTWYPEALKDEFIGKVLERSLDSEVEVVGQISEAELNDYYQRADFLIHPCREAFGMTILEAAANGCPSIFTGNSGVASLFPQSVRKNLANENNVDEFISWIKNLMTLNHTEYQSLVNVYHKTATENSWESHCKKILSLS